MRIKRVLQGTALTALAAAAWMGAADASAAELASSAVSVDTAAQTMTVTTTDKEVVFGVGAYNKNKGTVKVAGWDVYDVKTGSVTIDLSKLSNVKDNYVAVKTETTDALYIKIGSSVKSQKVKYDAVKKELAIDNVKNADTTAGQDKGGYSWQYRTAYGSWQDLNVSSVPFEQYHYQGASLYVRANATTTGALQAVPNLEVSDAADKSATPAKSPVYDGGRLPGKESKVNIAKQANGPSVAVDYAKGTVKVPDKAEYRVLLENANGAYDAAQTPIVNSTKTPQGLDVFLGTASGGVLEVRKVATDKKIASKWTRVSLKAPVELNVDSTVVADADIATDGVVVVQDKINVKYNKTNKGKYDAIVIHNGTDKNIEVIIADKKPEATAKSTVVKAGKDGKISKSKVTDGHTVYIRTSGVKATQDWAGAYTAVGKVKFPSDDPAPAK